MAVGRLGGPAMAAAVMRDDAKAVVEEEQHLRVPVIGRERPAVAEDNGLAAAPILVVDLRAILDGNPVHETLLHSRGYGSIWARFAQCRSASVVQGAAATVRSPSWKTYPTPQMFRF